MRKKKTISQKRPYSVIFKLLIRNYKNQKKKIYGNCNIFTGQYKTWTADYGLRTTDCGLRTTNYGLGIKHGLGIKRGLRYKTPTEHYGLSVKHEERFYIE